jgi:osmoprotectant transport system substrate-binding protein
VRRVPARRSIAGIAVLGLCAVASCGGDSGSSTPTTALGDDTVTVASFDFPESVLLGEIYGQALRAKGFDVELEPSVGPRQLVQPALDQGLVEFVPEYLGSAVDFLSLGADRPTDDVGTTDAALAQVLEETRLTALAPSPAQDANAVVVTDEVAERYGLTTISDLVPHAGDLVFGGPPGCTDRPFCLKGLQRTYGLRFRGFMPLDVGGPLTHQALEGGHVDVALLFTTDPQVTAHGLVELVDDRGLQPAENVTPVVRREVVDRWGQPFVDAVDAVSARLTTTGLQVLNGRVANGEPVRAVAAEWLAGRGLA